ncbi:shufflon system plasmid conjugative transfer pilus tip adhesin PilV [Salmonella enterica]|nr:shufflon system plasmid conjugative transfer pilus tip adhesin PilV [Salmonella enterica]EKQ5162962.1 shufflon system plasmid conjugative transfer pilus tip adhesin PilV [Salmonella enterica]
MTMINMKNKQIHNGLSLIEASVVILLIMLMMALATVYWKNATNNAEYNSTATQLNTVTNAAVDYIHDNYSDISKNVSTGKPVYVTGQQLRDAGYLMTGYSLTNNSHQDYQVAIGVNPKFSDRLVAFVLTQNGTEIPMDGLRTISAYAGGMAGYVHDDNIAEGAYGGWKVTLTDYGMSAKKGHLASFISSDKLGTNADAGDRLYRYSVDGHPALNQMQTSIDMDANDLNNVSTVNTADLAATNTITTKEMTASDTINTNILSATTVNASGNVTASGGVTGNTVRSNGRLSTGEYLQLDAVATVGAACSPNGLVSRDSNGAILSCQSGVWSGSSGGYPTGSPIPWPTATPPSGYLLCNGQSFNTAAHPKLASVYPSGTLPDLRGVFIRGLDNGRGYDSGRTILSYQADSPGVYIQGHNLQGHHSGMEHDQVGGESHPKNVAFNYIVKAE